MRAFIRRRERGQAIGLAAVGMVAMVALLAYVVDAGMFFMIRRELQNTADAAALAGAIYLEQQTPIPLPAPGPMSARCASLSAGWAIVDPDEHAAAQMACIYVERNSTNAHKLCVNDVQIDKPTFGTWPNHNSLAMVINVHCNAGYSFGRILGLQSKTIGAHATAVIGLRIQGNPNSGVTDWVLQNPAPPPGYAATTRLIAD